MNEIDLPVSIKCNLNTLYLKNNGTTIKDL